MLCCVCCMQALWISFGIVWDIAVLDLISPLVEETLYMTLDFCAKVRDRKFRFCDLITAAFSVHPARAALCVP